MCMHMHINGKLNNPAAAKFKTLTKGAIIHSFALLLVFESPVHALCSHTHTHSLMHSPHKSVS